MKMNYQSGDKLKNRYLSNDAFTSLKNKLGGRSITSLGNRRRNSYKIANQGFDLFDYKTLIYKSFVLILLLMICVYIIPQTRYLIHEFMSVKVKMINNDIESVDNSINDNSVYNIAPMFLKTDEFIAKQKDIFVDNGLYVYDLFTKNPIGVTSENSPSTVNIKLFSDAGFKNNFLIEQNDVTVAPINIDTPVVAEATTTDLGTTTADVIKTEVVKEADKFYQSYVFEGLGYGQLIAKVPPGTDFKKDSSVYIRTVDGLKPIAKIINVDKDNKSTFTIIHAQLIVSPQNIYKVIIK
jgi:hypothetical protein